MKEIKYSIFLILCSLSFNLMAGVYDEKGNFIINPITLKYNDLNIKNDGRYTIIENHNVIQVEIKTKIKNVKSIELIDLLSKDGVCKNKIKYPESIARFVLNPVKKVSPLIFRIKNPCFILIDGRGYFGDKRNSQLRIKIKSNKVNYSSIFYIEAIWQ